jgi:hypothetical protein
MNTVTELVTAATQLRPDQLKELQLEIERLIRRTCAWTLEVGSLTLRLVRLDDYEYHCLCCRSLAIKEDLGFLIRLHLAGCNRGEELTFPQVYLVLKQKFGESSQRIDPWKGAFSFPFALDVCRNGQEHAYLLEVYSCKDSLYFALRKIVAANDPRLAEHRYHPPVADEFSRDEINHFIAYLHGYMLGYWKGIAQLDHEPFVRVVSAANVVFGCCQGQVFEEQHCSSEDFERVCQDYRERVEAEKAARTAADPCVLMAGKEAPSSS